MTYTGIFVAVAREVGVNALVNMSRLNSLRGECRPYNPLQPVNSPIQVTVNGKPTAAARKRMSEASKKRWAEFRAKKAVPQKAKSGKSENGSPARHSTFGLV